MRINFTRNYSQSTSKNATDKEYKEKNFIQSFPLMLDG